MSTLKNKLTFTEAFEKYIKGKAVKELVSFSNFDYSQKTEERFKGSGIKVSGGYMYLRYGGGASGSDFNTSYIVSNKNILVAKEEEVD